MILFFKILQFILFKNEDTHIAGHHIDPRNDSHWRGTVLQLNFIYLKKKSNKLFLILLYNTSIVVHLSMDKKNFFL